jgi:hypothetical protein
VELKMKILFRLMMGSAIGDEEEEELMWMSMSRQG